MKRTSKNIFCEANLLRNEASVEGLFVNRLIQRLGFGDSQVRYKASIDEGNTIQIGHKKLNYKPDYVLYFDKKPRIVIDAKAPNEKLDDYLQQAAGYCLMLNQKFQGENPAQYFVLTNGYKTNVFVWDSRSPILSLDFDDFNNGNNKFESLCTILSVSRFGRSTEKIAGETLYRLFKPSIDEVNSDFAWCHQYIYKKGNISQAAGFEEFVKVVFLKLLSDRRVREAYPAMIEKDEFEIPAASVLFSTDWIEEREKDDPNPLDTIQFKNLVSHIEDEIRNGRRKRIFVQDDRINLSPEIIKGVVARIEHLYLFGIDADLNGRLFETFLNATMRGKDLGQFFTPRSIVKLGTKLAGINVSKTKVDVVLDACCGTGGFLIDALADMWIKVDNNTSLSKKEKESLKQEIAVNNVRGIDIGSEPSMARLARMNMYLHGDGGSKIFEADFLNKDIAPSKHDSTDVKEEKRLLKEMIQSGPFVDLVLTNPPFAKAYERNTPSELAILDQYEIAFFDEGGKRIPKKSLRSSLMFLERYYDVLKPGGRLVTVIDDGILGGSDYSWFRDFIRKRFKIVAVISLPGDAFQRSQARVKTSLLILEKIEGKDSQGSAFMYPCRFVGIDDSSRQRTLPIDKRNRELALEEIRHVVQLFEKFKLGSSEAKSFSVGPERLADRLDVKNCLESPGRRIKEWVKQGFDVVELGTILTPVKFQGEDVIETKTSSESVRYLNVGYDGYAREGVEQNASETDYSELYRVHENQIVISHISATYGAAAVVTKEFDGCVVAKEFSVLQAIGGIDPRIAWLILRAPEVRADMLLIASGANRTRIKWSTISELKVPIPPKNLQKEIVEKLKEAESLIMKVEELRKSSADDLYSGALLDSEKASKILQAYKPPK